LVLQQANPLHLLATCSNPTTQMNLRGTEDKSPASPFMRNWIICRFARHFTRTFTRWAWQRDIFDPLWVQNMRMKHALMRIGALDGQAGVIARKTLKKL